MDLAGKFLSGPIVEMIWGGFDPLKGSVFNETQKKHVRYVYVFD